MSAVLAGICRGLRPRRRRAPLTAIEIALAAARLTTALVTADGLIDFPQQARALGVPATEGGGAAIQTCIRDHVYPGSKVTISRQLAYLDAHGATPQGFTGERRDRNVTLYRAAPKVTT